MSDDLIADHEKSSTFSRPRISLWVVIGILWLIVGTLGFLGLSRYAESMERRTSPLDLLYLLLQLIALESGAIDGPIPWQLEVARFGLPALAAWTALRAFMLLFREQWLRIMLRFWRGHIIVCGLSRKGLLLAQNFKAVGHKVLIVEAREEHPDVDLCQSQGIPVLQGDSTEAAVLTLAGIQRASALIGVTDNDGINAEIAVRANEHLYDIKRVPLLCFIHIVDPGLWDLLRQHEIFGEQFEHIRLELFNVYQRGAEMLVEQILNLDRQAKLKGKSLHVLVIGLGQLGKHLIVHAAQTCFRQHETSHHDLRITAIDRQARYILEVLEARYPRLNEAAQIRAVSIDVESPEFIRGDFLFDEAGQSDIDIAFICMDDDSQVLATGLSLFSHRERCSFPIVLRMIEENGLADLIRGLSRDRRTAYLRPFALLNQTCGVDLVEKGTHESLARAMHASYLNSLKPSDGLHPDVPSLRAWEDLPEEIRNTNREQADHIGRLLAKHGYMISLQRDWAESHTRFSEDEIEAMAKMEHDRWCHEKYTQAWRYCSGPKNDKEKTHPDLRPWEDLPEAEKEKNRVPMRELPSMLHAAGFKIIRNQDDDSRLTSNP